ncbi:MAG: GNAT family N-acetyltransferase [Proteobacteria bacterium]|nr:GNAT family N-acetyltransferase [Pseudomonadota bacterium]
MGAREVLVALMDGAFAGYLTIVWEPEYEPFQDSHIPEVQDFNVLPMFRRKRIGTALMDKAEELVATRSNTVESESGCTLIMAMRKDFMFYVAMYQTVED